VIDKLEMKLGQTLQPSYMDHKMKYPTFLPRIIITGKEFYAKAIPSHETIEILQPNNPGDIGTIGKYKNKEQPYGSCIIAPKNIGRYDSIDVLLEYCVKNKKLLLELGAELDSTHFIIACEYKDKAFGFDFEKNTVELLAHLGFRIGFDFFCESMQEQGTQERQLPNLKRKGRHNETKWNAEVTDTNFEEKR